jgi:dipeptidyl aminopeptidase/acylaminoacyl peptidase
LRSIDTPKADSWLLDGAGVPRVLTRESKGQVTVSWFDPDTKQWVERFTAPQHDMPWVPVAARDARRMLVRTADGHGYFQLREYDAKEDKLADKPMLTTPGFSSAINPIYAQYSDRLLGLNVLVDGWTTTWLDPARKALQAKIDAKLPGRANDFDCSPCTDAKRVLVYSYSDNDPGMTLLYTPATDQWQMVGKVHPDIPVERMAHMELHRPKARDGEDLPVWITRSPTVPADKPAAAVVLVHGGPWLRGTYWGWHSEAQFLASRGYLVIEPEFRGSTGYGITHFKKGFKQWGLTMQDDVSDALKFAVDKGWVDPKRVCVMGGSYGGYATLMGLAKDPDQFRCGIALAAVSDQRYMFDFHWSDESEEGKTYDLPELLGDRKKDEPRFIATSPVEQASRIKAPLLLVHGGEDRRVPIQNAERMRDALQKGGKPVEWVVYPRAYHGFPLLEDELDYYHRVEVFLDKNLRAN